MSYNTDGQLTRIWAANSGNQTLTSFSYNYTNPSTGLPALLPYTVTNQSNATQNLSYDSGNSLTQDVLKNSGGTQTGSYFYGYDPAGNLNCKQSGGTSGTACASQSGNTTFTYNANNEVTTASGGMSMSYTYDGNGDRVSSSDGTSYALNAAGQITSITPPRASAVTMSYTGIGETQRTGRGSTSYQYDGTGVDKQTDASGDTYFTTLPDGAVLSETVPSGSYAGTYYYLSDGTGSVAALTDSTGVIQNSYTYDPLGTATSTGSVPNPYSFDGMTVDSATGFYYTGSGYYDPATGQAFGCQDQGAIDPGEDLCGEDEDPACDGVCSLTSQQGSFFSNMAGGECGLSRLPSFQVTGRTIKSGVHLYCTNVTGGTIIVNVHVYRYDRGYFAAITGTIVHCTRDVPAGGTDKCLGGKKRVSRPGEYKVCAKEVVTFWDTNLEVKSDNICTASKRIK